MEVYLVPVGAGRHEIYSEASHVEIRPGQALPGGFWRRQFQRFHAVLDRVEREHRRPPQPARPGSGPVARGTGAMRRRAVRWLAEKVAEQRVLWQLRGCSQAVAFVPADLDAAAGLDEIRRILQHEARRHGRWLVVNGVLLVLSAILAPLPGPNLIAYYFAFRGVGHYLARAGATNGVHRVEWTARPSGELVELRDAIRLDPAARQGVVDQVAARLRLEHLASFFARTVVPAP
jgi:hypothetical protein